MLKRLLLLLLLLTFSKLGLAQQTLDSVPHESAQIQFSSLQSDFQFEQLPISSQVDMHINSMISRTKVTQVFFNDSEQWLEGIYQFPLPEDAAVDSLKMQIGQRIIEGEIQEKQQAEQTYQAAKKQGKRTSLVKQVRDNLFTTKLANIGPKETIRITIEFQHLVALNGTQFSIRMPLAITPRFVPANSLPATQSSQLQPLLTSTVLPASVTRFNSGQAAKRDVTFTINLKAGFDLATLESPYHQIEIRQVGDSQQIKLVKATQADKDFVLQWQPKLGQEPSVAVFSERLDNYNYHLLMMMPPTHELVQEQVQAREIIFVIDSSGSMEGQSMIQAKAGLQFALQQLNPEDSFNIIDFDSHARRLFEQAQPVSTDNLVIANNFIEHLDAEGGTNIADAMHFALDKPQSSKLRQVIFLTDGSISNEQQIFSLIHNQLGNNRLFTIGIGSAPNSYFMKKAAEHGRGTFTYVASEAEVENKLNQLFTKLRYPILGDITLKHGPLASLELQPKFIPDLYLGEPLFTSYRTPINNNVPLQIAGKTDNYQWSFDLPNVVNGNDLGVAKLWARMKIDSLKNELTYAPNKGQSIKQQILTTALEHHLVSDYTSLVAVDKTPARTNEQLKQLKLANPNPAGWGKNAKQHGYPRGATQADLLLLIGLLSLLAALGHGFYQRKKANS